MTGTRIEPGTFGLVDECSTTELTLLLSDKFHPMERWGKGGGEGGITILNNAQGGGGGTKFLK